MPGTVMPSFVFARSATSDLSSGSRFGGQRHRPRRLVDRVGRRTHLGDQLVVAHEPGDAVPERDDLCAGQRRDVDDRVGLLVARGDEARRPAPAGPRRRCSATSTVFPPRMRSTSFGRVAVPDGMFSARQSQPDTRTGTSSSASATIVASTAAAPAMSVFMPTIDAIGFSESPPESKVMPLPMSARCTDAPAGAHSRRTSRGPRLEPLPTPRIPPNPSASSCGFVPDLRGDPCVGGRPHGDVRETRREQLRRRGVHEVLRAGHGGDHGANPIEPDAVGRERGVQVDAGHRWLRVGAVLVVGVRAERGTLEQRGSSLGVVGGHGDRNRRGVGELPHRRAGGEAEVRDIRALADAGDGDDLRPAARRRAAG